MLTSNIALNVSPGEVPPVVRVSQYDAGSRKLAFHLIAQDGELILPSGLQAEIRGTKPDGNGFSYICTIQENIVTANLTAQMTAVAGNVICEVILFVGTPATSDEPASADFQQLGTANFILAVEKAALDKDTLLSGSEIRQLVLIMDHKDEIIDAANRSEAATIHMAELIEEHDAAMARNAAESAAALEQITQDAKDYIDQKTDEIETDLSALKDAAEAAADAAKDSEDAAAAALVTVEEKKAQILNITTNANQVASQALTIANQALDESGATSAQLDETLSKINEVLLSTESMVDGGYEEDGYLYLTAKDTVVVGPLGPFAGGSGGGGGGGGSSATYVITLTNLLPSRTLNLAEGGEAVLRFNYTSVDGEGYDDGQGIGTIYIGSVVKGTFNVLQGANELDVTSFLSPGSNNVRLVIQNSEGISKSIAYSVTVVALSMKTTNPEFMSSSEPITYFYTPTGAGDKTIRFYMDGVEMDSVVVSTTGRSQRFNIPVQSHGAHIFEAWAEIPFGEGVVRSNVLRHGLIFIDMESERPIVLTTFNRTGCMQGDILQIPYMVYDPAKEQTAVTLNVINPDGSTYSSQSVTVSRTEQNWSVRDYPAGNVRFRITLGTVIAEATVAVEENPIVIETITDGLVFDFNPDGRSNHEAEPRQWKSKDGTVKAAFTGIGFSGADGWLTDSDGAAMLRILPGGEMFLPFSLFSEDRRSTGVAVEVEMATHNVRDYDSIVMSCLSGGRGFRIASQFAELASEQTSVSMQFKEDDKVRVTFSVEARTLHRLIYVYVNGVMCGAIQYPDDDDFQQNPAVGISVGAESSGIDVYRILLYEKGLTRNEVLANYIAGRSTLAERIAVHERNDILNQSEEISIDRLPSTLPYMIIECPELPQYKGDKKTCEITFVNPVDPSKSYTASGVQIDVQGTSSAGYKKKNFKIKFNNGVTFTQSHETKSKIPLRDERTSIPVKTFCLKADVASSESTNNVELARYYNDLSPFRTPGELADSRVRQTIDGYPIVVFWNNGETIRFWGKYNANNDKGTEDVFGLTEGAESWEIRNNTSSRVIWKNDDFTGDAWLSDFEARYPEDNTDPTNLAALAAWLKSTDRTVEGLTEEQKAARLAKFRSEAPDWFEMDAMIFYYIFTEVFLMVDSRAKNMFPTTMPETKWFILLYDADTSIGINNEGQLVFDYDLEDTDKVGGANVFNGQDSVLWNNLRDAFPNEIKTMYQELRSGGQFSYPVIAKRFTDHQAVWPEVVWNEDAWEKYLEPLETDNDSSYLTMLQGNKASQRAWWLFNAFRYRDSKYQCGDAQSRFITLRCYAVGDITVTPYSHIWPWIKYGSYDVSVRGKRNVPVTLHCPLDHMDDTEVYVRSADRLSAIGDLSPLMVGYANFSMATKLQSLKLGDGAPTYENTKLTELYVGNNELLTTLDVRHCTALATSPDLSGCIGLEEVRAAGSAVTGFLLPVGGKIKRLELPSTVTNLTIRDAAEFETLDMAGYRNLTTLRIENTPNVPVADILSVASSLNRVRLIGLDWEVDTATAFESIVQKLTTTGGLDASGGNTDRAVVSGIVRVSDTVTPDLLSTCADYFPDLVVFSDGVANCTVKFRNADGTLLYTGTVPYGGDAPDPVANHTIVTPTRETDERGAYEYAGWDTPLTNIRSNLTITAVYTVLPIHTVTFLNWDESLLYSCFVAEGHHTPDPVVNGLIQKPSRPTTETTAYAFVGWDKSLLNITADRTIYAVYSESVSYKVTFKNTDGTVLYNAYAAYGAAVADPVLTGKIPKPTREPDATYLYEYRGWNTALTNITADRTVTAAYNSFTYYTVTFHNWDSTVLYQQKVKKNYGATDPVTTHQMETPTRPPEEDYNYIYKGWDRALSTNVTSNLSYTAQYKTDQLFTVYFANWDGTVLDTQYVRDEDPAVNPITEGRIPTPLRPPSAQYEYTFSTWDKTFSKITGDTTITALYRNTTRSYTVRFMSGDEVLYSTVVLYNYDASYDVIPTKPGAIFEGWEPVPQNIKGDTDCYAVWNAETITDSWTQIFAAEEDGSYVQKYHVGDTKYIDLGEEGVNIMRIVAMDAEPLADGSGNAKISWVADYLSASTHQFAPALQIDADTEDEPGWQPTTVAGEYRSQVQYIRNGTADGTWTFTAGENGGTVTIYYKCVNQYTAYNRITVIVDGNDWVRDTAVTSYRSRTISIPANGSVTVRAIFQTMYNDNYYGFFKYTVNSGTVEVAENIELTPVVKEINTYVDATGGIGGWPKSTMRSWLQSTFKAHIPAEVLAGIKTVKKYTKYLTASASPQSVTGMSEDDVWIPSMREIFGGSSYETGSPVTYVNWYDTTAKRTKYHPYMDPVSYLTRTANNVRHIHIITNAGASGTVATSNSSYRILLGFCT